VGEGEAVAGGVSLGVRETKAAGCAVGVAVGAGWPLGTVAPRMKAIRMMPVKIKGRCLDMLKGYHEENTKSQKPKKPKFQNPN
jgi:hypothetical protein